MAELDSVIAKRLSKWRAKDEILDRGTWRGVSEIAGAIQCPKDHVRATLRIMAAAGRVERLDACNGTYWRAALTSAGEK